jgi:glycosyltransferase involved in cell wall biosynthesis
MRYIFENPMRWLTAIPVYNEAPRVSGVLAEVREHARDILIVNDGSTDGTAGILDHEHGLFRIDHPANRGYGAALASAFDFARRNHYDVLVTMDCDGQHQPDRIAVLLEQIHDCDIVSGSRYLRDFRQDSVPPTDRRFINATITAELNDRFGLNLTDSFCGFKAYTRHALQRLHVTERGWGMPLEVIVQAARKGLMIKEIGVPRIYLDPTRAFGGVLNDPASRLSHYREVIERADTAMATPRRQLCTARA